MVEDSTNAKSLEDFKDYFFSSEIPPFDVGDNQSGLVVCGFANPHTYHGAYTAIAAVKAVLPGLLGSFSRRLAYGAFEIIVWDQGSLAEDAEARLVKYLQSAPSGIQEESPGIVVRET